MIYLARHEGLHPVPLSEIAASEGISPAFLERVVAQLRDAGLVTATRGAAGGYRLASPVAAISAGDVVAALEGPLEGVECVHDALACDKSGECRSRSVWERLDAAIAAALAGVTLEELATEEIEQ